MPSPVRMRPILTALLGGVLSVSMSCGSATSTQDEFMKMISNEGIHISATELESIAHDVCDSFRNHPNAHKSEVVLALAIKHNWTPQQAGVFTGAAIGAYCMEYKSRTWE